MFLKFFINKIFNLPENCSIVILNGGIGNQLFQYLLGEELKNHYKRNVIFFDIRNSYAVKHESYIENFFEVYLNKYIPKKNNILVKYFFLNPLFLKISKLIYFKFGFKLIPILFFDNFENKLNPCYLKNKKNLTIYFGTWHTLINSYNFASKKIKLRFKNASYFENKNPIKNNFIALHVRRGDYINSKVSNFHGILNISYFSKAVNYLRNKFGDMPVYLFSDDYFWVVSNLQENIKNSDVISSMNSSAEADLFYMSKAKYFIISNSTFSWWAAYLSSEKDKFIVLPKFWFKNFETNDDLIFKHWQHKIM